MDVEKFIDGFDSLWFFSNIFSSSSSSNMTQNLFDESSPTPPILQTKQVHEDLEHVEMVSVVLKSSSEFSTTVKKEKRSSPKRRDKDHQKEEMFMQFKEFIEFSDFDFTSVADTEELLYGELTPMGPKLYHHHPYLFCKMPSLNDGMAMKEHLKSWACAVASTVK